MVAIFTGAGAGFARSSANLLGGAGQMGSSLLGRGGESVSVNAATGNLLISKQDEFLVGRGPDIGISRTYNSFASAGDGDNGDQWQQSTTRRVFGLTGTLNTAGSTISRLSGDGSVIVYAWDAARSAYVTKEGAGAFDTLTNADDVWTWTDGDTQSIETYSAHGTDNWRITAAADTDGNTLAFTYVGDKLDKVTTADGAWTQYAWSGNNITEVVTGYTDLATSTAKTLTRVRYAYDGNDRLVTVTTDLTPEDNSIATGPTYVTTYTYDGASNRVASIAQTDGSLLEIAYDGSGRVITLTQTVASGVTRITGIAYGTNYTSVTGPDGQVTRLDYDALGQLTKVTAPPATTGATAQEVHFAYDADGNVISVIDGNGHETEYDHDDNGNVILVTDATGNTVQRTYDASNRLITEFTSGADRDGPSIAHYKQYIYDSEGHLRFAMNAAGQTTEYRYTATGELYRTISYVDHRYTPPGAAAISLATMEAWVASRGDLSSVRIVENTYDARGNVTVSRAYGIADAAGEPLTTEGSTTSYFVHDQAGKLLARNRHGEVAETFVYDGMGRLTSSVDTHGGTTTIVFNDGATTTTITTALGYSTVSTFNKAGELISKTDSGANTTGGTESYQYDAAGRLRIFSDATGRKSYIYYDNAGRKVAEVNHLGEITEYRYDAANRLIASIAYATAVSAGGLLTLDNPASTAELSSFRPTANAADVWGWSIYDDAGRLIQAIDNTGSTVTYEFDTEGKLAKTIAYYTRLTAGDLAGFRTAPPTAQVLPAAHAQDAISRVFYNKAGQEIGTLDAEGYLTETIRDGAGLAIQTFAYAIATNPADRASSHYGALKASVAGGGTADRISRAVYDGQGLLRYSINGRGGVTSYEYNAAGQLVRTTVHATEQTFSTFTYTAVKAALTTHADDRTSWTVYDTAGRVAYTVDAMGGVVGFAYDAEGRVVKAVAFDNAFGSAPSLSGLDSWAANAAQANDTSNRVTRSRYTERGELLYSVDAEGFVTRFTYDAEGRVASKIAYGGAAVSVGDATTIAQIASLISGRPVISVSTTYDNAGRVLTTTDGDGYVTRNVYNALGQLTDVYSADNVSTDRARTQYVYDGAGRVIVQSSYDANGSSMTLLATVQFAYDGLGNQTSVTDALGNVTAYTYNELGRVLTITNALSGVSSYTYDAFGNVVLVTDPKGNSTYNYYDRLNRLVTVRDAANYVTRTRYNRFGEAVDVRRYANVFGGTPQVGVNPTGDPDAPYAGPSPAVVAAYANATQLQNDANAAAAALAAEQAALAATLADPMAFLQNKLSELQAHKSYLQAQYDAANWFDRLFVWQPQINTVNSDIDKVETNITRVQNSQGLDSWGTTLVNNAYNVPALQTAYNNAQAAANQALADAQAMEAAEIAGDFGPYSGAIYSYDRLGRVSQKVDAEGFGETYTYSAFGQVLSFRRFEGGVGTPNFAETLFEYDERGSLLKSTDARGFHESYTYDAFGRQVSKTGKSNTATVAAGGTTTYVYNNRGLLVSETLPVQSYNPNGTVSGAITNTYGYDARGNLIQKTQALGRTEELVTHYTYDKLDRLLTTVGEAVTGVKINASTKAVSADSGSPTETYTYDANGNLITTVDAAGAKTVFFYDALGRKVVEINALGTYTAYQYDANGNVTNIRVFENTVTVPANGGAAGQAPGTPSGAKRETTFSYNSFDQMLTSNVLGATTGSWTGSSWSSSTAALTTTYQYDYLGNVVKLTDPNGGGTFSYYDRLGRKTAQVDAEGYLTTWTYNSDGNVLSERRYATRFTGTPTTAGPPSVSTNGNDRVTNYTYDKMGNRLSEARTGVSVHNGSGGVSTVTSTISYLYNGLGQVTRKSEATGDQFNYTYDVAGRLTQETRPQFASNSGNVTPTLNYFYDGLGNLVRNVQAAGGDAVARITTYTYGAGGRLTAMTDAEGKVRSYQYDRAGRLVLETYVRTWDDGTGTATINEGVGYRYDALGRSLGQGFYKLVGSNWVFQSANDHTTLQYNAFGDVTRTGVNGLWQQETKYDLAGRAFATNSGDGVWKYFGYDRNGNQTIAIASAGADTSGKTFAQALAMVSQATVNATYTVYDKRNLATSIIEEGRQLSSAIGNTLTSSRTYTAFGEVATETNAANATIIYTYNTMGRLTRSASPTIQITQENGTSIWVRPAEDYYYDASGRLVATRDANGTYGTGGTSTNGAAKGANTGNLNRLTLLAGTGYGGSEALVTHETHADGGIKQTRYDIHGNARVLIDEENRTLATNSYDKLGRLTTAVRLGGLTDNYTYDELGQQLTHWNSLYTSSNKEVTIYDIQGRVITTRAFGGDLTSSTYTWGSTIGAAAIPGVAPGGWTKVSTYANTRTLTERTDIFGRTIQKIDLGGNTTNYTYDAAGRLTKSETTNGTNVASYNYEYFNTGQVSKSYINAQEWHTYGAYPTANYYSYYVPVQQIAAYTYDAVGNRLTEYGTLVVNGGTPTVWKNQIATYDALGRLKTVNAAEAANQSAATTTFEYDANGNIRKRAATFYPLNGNGTQSTTQTTAENWFLYDSMNRVVLNNGKLDAGQIQRRSGEDFYSFSQPMSESIAYNKAGQRTSLTTTQASFASSYPAYWVDGYTELKDVYNYDASGRLTSINQVTGAKGPADQPYTPPPATGTGIKRSEFTYDAMGRQLTQKDYNDAGTQVIYNSTTTYNAKGHVSNSYSSTLKNDNKTYTQTVVNTFGSGATYALGAVVTSTSTNTVTGQSAKTSLTTNTYQWWDSAVQNSIAFKPDNSASTTYNTYFYYNALGQLSRVSISDGMPRTVTFTLDELGQIIRRDETRPSNAPTSQNGSPHEVWYRFGDREFGYISNNSSMDVPLSSSIMQRQSTPPAQQGTYNGGRTFGSTVADFNQGLGKINSFSQGSTAGGYTIQSGDTLQGLAQRLYGDAGLWYKIAEANGLSAGSQLIEGRQLTLPGGVLRNTNSTSSYSPYDPARAIGDLSPSAPKPQKNNKCGFLGQILLAAIAIGVTIVSAGALAAVSISAAGGGATSLGAGIAAALGGTTAAGWGLTTVGLAAVGATSAAVGSVVSQAVGVATGIQEKFSWGGVAMAALGGAVGAGLGPGGVFKNGAFSGVANSGVVQSALRGATGSAIAQGVAVATGLQSKFSWVGVAAAGVGAAAGYTARSLFGAQPFSANTTLSNHLANFGASSASLIASAATRSAISGTNFGDNIMAGLPDVLGQLFANMLIEGVSAPAKEVAESPVRSAGGGGGSGIPGFMRGNIFRQGGSGLPPIMSKPVLPAKFGGAANADPYAMNYFDDWWNGAAEWVQDTYASFEQKINAISSKAGEVLDAAIVVTAELASDVAESFQSASNWAVDQSAREVTKPVSNFFARLGQAELQAGAAQRQASQTVWKDAVRPGVILATTPFAYVRGLDFDTLNANSAMTAPVPGLAQANVWQAQQDGLATGVKFDYGVTPLDVASAVPISYSVRVVGALRAPSAFSRVAAIDGVSARHIAWSSDVGAINDTVAALGQRALRDSGGDWRKSEALFNRYLSLADARLARAGSNYAVELQPAAIAGGERVPNFIWLHRGDETSPLIMANDGTPRLFAYPGSRRLDAGIIDLTAGTNQHGLRPIVSGYDITINKNKAPVVGYYREYFGNVPIRDIRP